MMLSQQHQLQQQQYFQFFEHLWRKIKPYGDDNFAAIAATKQNECFCTRLVVDNQ